MLKKTIFFTILSFFYSCEKNYDYKPQQEARLLVVNATLSNLDGIKVHISQPLFSGETKEKSELLIKNATVTLFDDTAKNSYLLKYNNGFYVSNQFKAESLHIYHLEAIAPDFPTATTELVTMPEEVSILDTTSIQRNDLAEYDSEKVKNINLIFADSKSDNYYNSYSKMIDAVEFSWALGAIRDLPSTCEILGEGFFKDICFNGTMTKLTYRVFYNEKCSIDLYFEHISPSYYEYEKSRRDISGVISFFEEPIIRYSNIKNGYGVFIAKNTQKLRFNL